MTGGGLLQYPLINRQDSQTFGGSKGDKPNFRKGGGGICLGRYRRQSGLHVDGISGTSGFRDKIFNAKFKNSNGGINWSETNGRHVT